MNAYDYLMFKPESQKNFSKIFNLMLEEKFELCGFYHVNDWKSLSEKLYRSQLENQHFKVSFESLAYIINELFGNDAVICLIKENKEIEEQRFYEKVLAFKKRIRERFCKADQIYLVANIDKMPINRNGISNNGKLMLQSGNGTIKPITRCQEDGLFKFHSLSYIHCPDSDKEVVLNELHLLYKEGIIDKSNEISKESIEKIMQYATFSVLQPRKRIYEMERD